MKSGSLVDFESSSEDKLWLLHRSIDDYQYPYFEAISIDCQSLIEERHLKLKKLKNLKNLINSFVACNHLYIITVENNMNVIRNFYDLNNNKYINDNKVIGKWKRNSLNYHPLSIQFDSFSKTINIFDNGFIYSINTFIN